MTKINKNKYYSIRETAKLIPWINSEPTLQKLIHEDIDNNGNRLFKAIVLKRKKQRRYYLKGEYIQEVIDKANSDSLARKNVQ